MRCFICVVDIAIHGNGDAGIEDILNAFEEAQKAYPRANARHIIIHCQTVREDQLDRIERLGVVPSFFTVHTYYWGDRHRDIFLGKARASRIDPLRSALKRGIPFTSHNDTSVTPMDPLLSVWSAVNRLTGSGKVKRQQANRRHYLEHKSSRLTRRLASDQIVTGGQAKVVKKMLGK